LVLPIPDFSDSATVRHYVEVTEALERFEALHEAEHPLGELVANLQRELNFGDSADAVGELLAGAELHDSARYRTAYQSLSVLSDAQQRNARRSELRAEFEVVAPGLCAAIDGDPNPTWDVRLERLTEARNWCEARAWITQSPHDAQGLQRQLERVREKIKEDRGALISNRAWDLALGRLSQRDTASLGSYVLAVGTLGRGTGKYAASRRRDVQERLKACRGAVAAWIMPLHRVFSDMRPEAEMFDIVIVDEASQAGTEANFLHYLAPRVLVIGDDKQVAPEAPGLDLSQIHALVDNYLGEIPEDQRLVFKNPAISYFDHAKIRTDTITLTEHFRCVPEIIEFSNREFYRPAGIELTPVRQYGTDRLRPLKSHFVSDGYRQGTRNQPEAEALVEELCRCVGDPAYTREGSDGEPEPLTMGVISLTDRHQAEAISNMLLDRLPEGELRARQIRCGTAADFQGSERDVIFLSMVNSMTGATEDGSGEIRYMPLTRARAERRYNVACSRAKDQMWLFHSLQIAELSNTEDLRLRLLSFYDNQTFDPVTGESLLVPEDEKVPPFDSVFEQRVHNEIVRKGYRLVPQFKVYGRKIDLVVEGATSRLAVECDGDHWHGPDQYQQDTERQRDLERVGWKFFRVRESEFNYDRVQALEPLWDLLDDLGIDPLPSSPEGPPPSGSVAEVDPPADLSEGRTDRIPEVDSSGQATSTEEGFLRAQNRELHSQLEELRAGTGSSDTEENQQVREEIATELLKMRSIKQGLLAPRQFTLGPFFVTSLEELGGRYRRVAIRVSAEVISDIPKLLSKRDDHPMRTGNKATAGPRIRDDGAEARRCYLERRKSAARRLHYWKLPDGSIELAVVTVHDDMDIPSS
jgi:very-short-patch-repair endonuclease